MGIIVYRRPSTLAAVAALVFAASCVRPRSDAQIASEVRAKIVADNFLQRRQIGIAVSNGLVTLSGSAVNDAERSSAVTDAAGVESVRTVINNITIVAPTQTEHLAPAAASERSMESQATPQPSRGEQNRPPDQQPSMLTPLSPRLPQASSSALQELLPHVTALHLGGTTLNPLLTLAKLPSRMLVNAPPTPVTIAEGTTISIRLLDSIDTENKQVGESFRATLASPLENESGATVIPAGYYVTGRIDSLKNAGRFAGYSAISIELTQLSVNGKSYILHTNQYTRQSSGRGKSTVEKVGGGAALGAVLGAILGGGKGAAIGAAVGAGAGTGVSAAAKPKPIVLPSETSLSFRLQSPLAVIPTSAPPRGRQKQNATLAIASNKPSEPVPDDDTDRPVLKRRPSSSAPVPLH